MQFRRTHTCGALREEHIGQEVVLSGWVHKLRNFGSFVFMDLRDRFGITQVMADPQIIEGLRSEYVVTVRGKVVQRKDPNKALATGMVEILAHEVTVLSRSDVLPLVVADATMDISDEVRLQYRYLDMRKGPILNNLILRHKVQLACRNYMDQHNFTEVGTPILGKSTPEGARDYLVPSRLYPGSFYALPQSPQLYKQILMVGGLDRYFQFATCFRDEDSRADRQPEFAQLDIEMSFATQDDLFPLVEKLMCKLFADCLGVNIQEPFVRMSYADCMELYGTDKPDLRFGMSFVSLQHQAEKSSFTVFHDLLAAGGVVKGFCVPAGASCSRKEIDEYSAYMADLGMKGLGWIKLQESGFTSSLAKYIQEDEQSEWIEKLQMKPGDAAFVMAGPVKKVNQALDHLRRRVAKKRGLVEENSFRFLWVTDFPLFAWNEEEQRMESEHHPFTSPNFDDMHLIEVEPLRMRSSSYDLVLNGYEMASGSQRIHDSVLQDKIFELLGFSQEERVAKFGFFIEALRYGTPPHLGIAVGVDRLLMIMAGASSIREVIAFPKTQRAQDLMTRAPSMVSEEQMKELKIKVETVTKLESL